MNSFNPLFLYIDPGTGSMLISVFIGLFASLWFLLKKIYIKVKFSIIGGDSKTVISTLKDEDVIIFSDSKRYENLFSPILDELDKRKFGATYITFDDDDPILSKNFSSVKTRCIGKGNKAFAILNTLSAKLLLSTTPSLDVYQWKRSKNVDKYIHILHDVGSGNEYRMFGLAFYDAVLLSGEFQKDEIRAVEKAEHSKEKELFVVGSTYMDELQKKFDNRYSEVNPKHVLVAPTWGKNGLLFKFGFKLIDSLLNTKYDIIIRPHPQSFTSDKEMIDNIISKYKNNSRIEFNYDTDNFNVLSKSKIMISDYSGVIFDYSFIFNRPVLYMSSHINNDINDSWFLDEEIYRYKAMRKVGIELHEADFANLETIIDSATDSHELQLAISEEKDKLWQNRGNSASKVCDILFDIIK